jgi:hypothetical protein
VGAAAGNGARVVAGVARDAEAVATLVHAGVRLYAVERELPDLEDVYFALHGKRRQPAAGERSGPSGGLATEKEGRR